MQAALNPVDFAVTKIDATDLKFLLLSEFEEELRDLSQPLYRAEQITDWLYKKRVDAIEKMTDLPQSLRARLAQKFSFSKADIVQALGAGDSTRKFLFRLADGNLIDRKSVV